MIRRVELQDAKAIAAIYNEYVIHSVVTFDIEPVREEDMRGRIAGISAHYPYFVCESDGKVVGYCYAHPWKQRFFCTTYVEERCPIRGDSLPRGARYR